MYSSSAIFPFPLRRSAADEAYSAWFNAQQRCTEALRAWNAARGTDRESAYCAYVIELEIEGMAAEELSRHHTLRVAV